MWSPFITVTNSNTRPNSAPLRDIGLRNRSDLDTDLSRSLKSNVIAPMDSTYILFYYCLIVTYDLTAPLRDIMLWNLSNFDLSRTLKVKCDCVFGLPIYGSLLMFNSNMWPNSSPLRDNSFQNVRDLVMNLSRTLRSNVITSMDSPYMLSLLCLRLT